MSVIQDPKKVRPSALPALSSHAFKGSIRLTLPPSPSSLVLQVFKALPFGSSEAGAMLCQVSDNTDSKYKQSSTFLFAPYNYLDFVKVCDYIASNAFLLS